MRGVLVVLCCWCMCSFSSCAAVRLCAIIFHGNGMYDVVSVIAVSLYVLASSIVVVIIIIIVVLITSTVFWVQRTERRS